MDGDALRSDLGHELGHAIGMIRLITVATLIFVSMSQTGYAQKRFRAMLRVQMMWTNVIYGDANIQGQALVLNGEPIRLEISVVNRYPGGPGIPPPRASAERDWPNRITATIRPGGRFDDTTVKTAKPLRCNVETTRDYHNEAIDEFVELESDGYQLVQCQLAPSDYGLATGKYTIELNWSEPTDAQRYSVRYPGWLGDTLEFEFRDVRTRQDELDLLLHLATHAWLDRNFDEAMRLTAQVLTRTGESAEAQMLRGRIRKTQGLCDAARAEFERAADVVERGLDAQNRRLALESTEMRWKMASELRAEARDCRN